MKLEIDTLTLFPDIIKSYTNESILKIAQKKKIIKINVRDIRDWTDDKHKKADDSTFGGGAGMVLKPEPIFEAMDEIKREKSRVIYFTPAGEKFDYNYAKELTKEEHLIFICGHYEGIDDRVRQKFATDEISIGDYVLTGGELPCLVVIDAIARLIPEVLGNKDSSINDSFSNGLLDYPHYTRPAEYRDIKVPDILLSGNHKKIKEWRRKKSLELTYNKRKDLLKKIDLSCEDKNYIKELEDESL